MQTGELVAVSSSTFVDEKVLERSDSQRLLAKHGYPPDGRDDATNLVLRQMETFADEWSPDATV